MFIRDGMSDEDTPADDNEQPQSTEQPQGQPQGQPQAQPQGQPAPAQGQQPVQQGPSLVDELQDPASMEWLKYNVVVFAAVGVGYSLAFLLFESLLPGGGMSAGDDMMGQFIGAIFAMFGLIGGLSAGTAIAAVNGIRIGREYQVEQNLALANSFAGSAGGFLVMALIMTVFLASNSLGDVLVPLIGFAVGVGATGAATTYVTREF